MYAFLADLTVVIHLAFVLFVIFGGSLGFIWPKAVWLHLPALVWGGTVELGGFVCPLTPLENYFREQADIEGYSGGFIQHYIVPVIYPEGLTREIQFGLGAALITFNLIVYWLLWRRSLTRA